MDEETAAERDRKNMRSFKKHFWLEISENREKEKIWLFLEDFFLTKLEVNQTSTLSSFYGW